MPENHRPSLPLPARIARVLAVAAWPIGFVFGLALAGGQDAPGQTIAIFLGLLSALVVSLLSIAIYFLLKSEVRVARIRRHARLIGLAGIGGVAVFSAWYLQPLFIEQQYAADIENRTKTVITNVEVVAGDVAINIPRLAPRQTVMRYGLTERPRGNVTVRWLNADGERIEVVDGMTGGPPRRFDGGTFVVNILSEHYIHTYFVRPAD